jgi:hypothetical protein
MTVPPKSSPKSLELIVWLVPSLIGGAIAVSIVGLLLGPMYPLAMNHAGRVLPRWLLTASIGWIAGFGQAGSALFPFVTGALASRVGIQSLQPLCVFLFTPVSQPRDDSELGSPQVGGDDVADAPRVGLCANSGDRLNT